MPAPVPSPSGHTLPIVLVVDDDATIRETFRQYIAGSGYQALEAGDVDEALDLLILHPIKAVILDLRLPTRSGFELLGLLRQHEAFARIPALVLTGYALTPDELDIARRHNAFVLYKPEHPDTLVRHLDRMTGRARTGSI